MGTMTYSRMLYYTKMGSRKFDRLSTSAVHELDVHYDRRVRGLHDDFEGEPLGTLQFLLYQVPELPTSRLVTDPNELVDPGRSASRYGELGLQDAAYRPAGPLRWRGYRAGFAARHQEQPFIFLVLEDHRS